MVEIDEVAGFEIVSAHLEDGFGYLLSVGPDILNRRAACIAGNACETLDACVSAIDGVADDIVPVFTRAHLEYDTLPFPSLALRARHPYAHHKAIKAGVANQ